MNKIMLPILCICFLLSVNFVVAADLSDSLRDWLIPESFEKTISIVFSRIDGFIRLLIYTAHSFYVLFLIFGYIALLLFILQIPYRLYPMYERNRELLNRAFEMTRI